MHFFFFPASSFYPGRGRDNDNVNHLTFPLNDGHLSNDEDGETEIEDEEDWLTEPLLGELPTRNASRASEAAMLIEVRILFFSSLLEPYCFISSGLPGMTLPPFLSRRGLIPLPLLLSRRWPILLPPFLSQ
jgi:hypothetical protein